MSRPLPWYFWATVAAAGVLLLLVLVPPLRGFVVEAVAAVLAGAVGVRSVQRRSAARDEATEAIEDHREAAAVETHQTESRQERASERASEALGESVESAPPEDAKDRERRAQALGADPLG